MQTKRILKIMNVLLVLSLLMGVVNAQSAWDIQWWSQATYSNSPANTLKQWAEAMEGRVGVNPGTGRIFYVDSNVSSEGGGTSWTSAKDTLDEAINLCTADRGDVIYIAQGHTETLGAAADEVDIDVDGVTIIQVGSNTISNGFDFTATTAGGNFAIGADDVTLINLRFHANITTVAEAVDIEAGSANVAFIGCLFDCELAATDEFTDCLDFAGADDNRLVVMDCRFEMGGAAANAAINFLDSDYARIIGNTFSGDYSVACINNETTASIHIVIEDNVLFNGTTGGDAGLNTLPCITLVATTTGIIKNNACFTNTVTPTDAIVAADCYSIGNTYSEDEAVGGSIPIGQSQEMNILAALGVATTDGSSRGRVVYCDSGETSTVEDGLTWATATDTLDEAVNLCSASSGDVIFVAPGHAESFTTADDVDVDVAGITIIGLGEGQLRPTFSYTANGEFVLGANGDNSTIKNLRFIATSDSVVKAIDVEAGCVGWTIENCEFKAETTTTDEFDDVIIIGAASDEGTIRNCRFLGDPGSNADPQSCINFVDCDYLQIIDCQFYGDRAVACIENASTASNHIVIKDNILFNGIIGGDAGLNAVACISLVATTTGVISGNVLACDLARPELAIVAADCYLAGNTYTEQEASDGGSVPIGSAAISERCVWMQLSTIASGANDLFAVTGGPIKMTEFVIYVDGVIQSQSTLIGGNIDPTTPATDTVFGTDGTALEINGDAAGSVYVWDGVLATDFAVTTNGVAVAMGTDVSYGMFVPPGMIELTSSAASSGILSIYMVYKPLSPQSVVTPQ
jgi:hypothetical protein